MSFFVLVFPTAELLSFFDISAEPILGIGFTRGLRSLSQERSQKCEKLLLPSSCLSSLRMEQLGSNMTNSYEI
jgi:hypothetical protein